MIKCLVGLFGRDLGIATLLLLLSITMYFWDKDDFPKPFLNFSFSILWTILCKKEPIFLLRFLEIWLQDINTKSFFQAFPILSTQWSHMNKSSPTFYQIILWFRNYGWRVDNVTSCCTFFSINGTSTLTSPYQPNLWCNKKKRKLYDN